uniref:Uncharacterized protein n=1 Tax=viral metagenome TaxID=1070528 RepID=A0A6C0ATB6_9ZZZZ
MADPYEYVDAAQQYRGIIEGRLSISFSREFVLPPRSLLRYVVVGPGADAVGGGGGGGGAVRSSSITSQDDPIKLRFTLDTAFTRVEVVNASGAATLLTNAAPGAPASGNSGGTGNAGQRSAAGANPSNGEAVTLWGDTPVRYGRGGAGTNGTPWVPQTYGQGGDSAASGSPGTPEGAPGAVLIWITRPLVVAHTATLLSVVRRAGQVDGLLTDMPLAGPAVPQHGLTFTGAPVAETSLDMYYAPLPILDAAYLRYVTAAEPNGVLPVSDVVETQPCVHQAASLPGRVIVLVRGTGWGVDRQLVLAHPGSTLSTLRVPAGFTATYSAGETLLTTSVPYADDAFYRFVFAAPTATDVVRVTGAVASNPVIGASQTFNFTVPQLGDTGVITRDGVLPTGERDVATAVMWTGDVLETREFAANADPTTSGVPRTPSSTLTEAPFGAPTAKLTLTDITAEFPLASPSGGATLVNATATGPDDVYPYDAYDRVHFQTRGQGVASTLTLPSTTQFYTQPDAPGVTGVFEDPVNGETLVVSTNPSVAPRRVETSFGVYAFETAGPALLSSAGGFATDPRGVTLRPLDVDGAGAGRPLLEAAYDSAVPRVGGNPGVAAIPPHVYADVLRDEGAPTQRLRVYDALYGALLLAVQLSPTSFAVGHIMNAEATYTVTAASGGSVAGSASATPAPLAQDDMGLLPPGAVAIFSGGLTLDGVVFRVLGRMVQPRVVALPNAGVLSSTTTRTMALRTVQRDTLTMGTFVNAGNTGFDSVPLGLHYVDTDALLLSLDDGVLATGERAPFRVPRLPTAGLQRTAITRAADALRVVQLGAQGADGEVPVDGITPVDGFVYGPFMAYPDEVILPDPEPPGPPQCVGRRLPTVQKYGVPPAVVKFLGVTLTKQTVGSRTDTAGARQRLPYNALAALAWMAQYSANVRGEDLAFAAMAGCPPPLLAALRLLPVPVPEAAFAAAEACFGTRV